MPLYLFLSHTGRRFAVDTDQIPSYDSHLDISRYDTDLIIRPDALKQWITNNVDVPVGRQILMTSQGKNVKQQHLIHQGEIFIYDKRFLLGDEDAAVQDDSQTNEPNLPEVPSELESETSLPAWQQLFRLRKQWASEAIDIVRDLSTETAQFVEACENIDRSTTVALDNLRNHVNSLKSSFQKTQAWGQDTLQEHVDILREWGPMAQTLKELPIREDMARLMTTGISAAGPTESGGTMYALLDPSSLEQANTTLESSSNDFRTQVDGLSDAVTSLDKDSSTAAEMIQIDWPNLDSENLLQEAETLATKVSGDYEDVMKVGSDNKAISRVSRVAAGHTNDLLPGLQEIVAESFQVRQGALEHRNNLSRICFRVLREVSKIQSTLAGLQTQISNLALSEEGQNSLEALDRV